MTSNRDPGNCNGDYYCDANKVCGLNCDEMDLVEANKYAFHAAAHTAFDGSGRSNGWGGGNAHRAFGSAEYGPDGFIIDTNAPFRVHAFFATDDHGDLSGIELTLQQSPGRNSLRFSVAPSWYAQQMTASFKAGMTPVMSYWSAKRMDWLDSPPCGGSYLEQQDACGELASFSDVAVCDAAVLCERDGAIPLPPPPPPPPPSPTPSSP